MKELNGISFDLEPLKKVANDYSENLAKCFDVDNPVIKHIANSAMCCLTMAMDYLISLNSNAKSPDKEATS